jgi:phage regulator Rha-like protein
MNNSLSTTAEQTMSSREISELTGKRHDNVVSDIKKMFMELEIYAPDFSGTYRTVKGNEYACYHLNRELTDCLLTGYSAKTPYGCYQTVAGTGTTCTITTRLH